MPVGDPFDFSNADPNAAGFLGQSPQWWQHLAMFGGNLAADASQRNAMGFPTYGSGIAGPLGAATAQTLAEAQQQQLGRASLTSQNIANETNALGLPVARRRAQIQLQALNNPGMFGGGGSPQDSGTTATAPDQASTPGAVPPEQRLPMSQAAVAGTPISPRLMDAVVQQESGWVPTAKNGPNGEGGNGLAQVLQSTAANPGFGLQPHPDALSDPVANLRFGAQYLYARGKAAGMSDADFSDPAKIPIALAAYHANVDNPRYVAQVMARMQQPPSWAAAQQEQQAQQAQQQGGGVQSGPASTGAMAAQLNAAADSYEQRARAAAFSQWAGVPSMDDPAMLRQLAVATRQKALELQTAGPLKGAEAAAAFPYQTQRSGPGGIITAGDRIIASVPQKSEEVLPTGPNAGMVGQVYREPMSGAQVTPAGEKSAAPGMPSGFLPTKLAPQQEGRLKAQGEIEADEIKADRKVIDEDLAHVIDNAQPSQQQLLMLRHLAPQADTGAGGQFRATVRNYFQTFAPDFATGLADDAAPAQEFAKTALMQAGKAERADLGARGGFRAIEMYANANPNLEMQPNANVDMANALLISHQRDVDYASGASNHYIQNRNVFMDPQAPKPYVPLPVYDAKFMSVFKPELYYSAIQAINGKSDDEWSKGLTPAQVQIVGGIIKRADPNADVVIRGQRIPVSAFKNTIDPTEIVSGQFGTMGKPNGG